MLKFGIEIEYKGSPYDVSRQLDADLPNFIDRRSHTSGFSNTDWMLKYDGSVTGGGELVSPPLDFDNPDDRAQVTRAVLSLQRAGAQPCQEAGIHVHVHASHEDGTRFTPREVAAAVRFFHKFQDIIYRIASSGWTKMRTATSNYAVPIDSVMASDMMRIRTESALRKRWYSGYTESQLEHYHPSRYRGINLHSFFNGPGTIEFRVFNSSLNPDRIQAYIALSCAIIRDVRNGYNRSVKKSYELGGMATGATDEAAAMLRFQQILRYESGMTAEDWKNLRKTCWNDSVPQPAELPTPGRNS